MSDRAGPDGGSWRSLIDVFLTRSDTRSDLPTRPNGQEEPKTAGVLYTLPTPLGYAHPSLHPGIPSHSGYTPHTSMPHRLHGLR